MGKLLVKLLPTDECNEDFAPDKQLQDGLECDHALMILFRDDKPYASIEQGICVDHIQDFLEMGDDVAVHIRQACAMAEGELRAHEIGREAEKRNAMKGLAKHLAKAMEDGNVEFGSL